MTLLLALAAMAGIQGGQSAVADRFLPSIRICNAVLGAKSRLDFLLDGSIVAEQVEGGTVIGPLRPNSEWHETLSVRQAGQAESLLHVSLDTAGQDHIVVVTRGADEEMHFADLSIKSIPEADGAPRIYFLNDLQPSEEVDSVDVYVLAKRDSLDSAHPAVRGITRKSPQIIPEVPGTYKIIVTPMDSKDVLAESMPFEAGVQNRIAVIVVSGPEGSPERIISISL